jgi:hypothetical protein
MLHSLKVGVKMGRRNNFLTASELANVHKNSKTYALDYATSIELFTNYF